MRETALRTALSHAPCGQAPWAVTATKHEAGAADHGQAWNDPLAHGSRWGRVGRRHERLYAECRGLTCVLRGLQRGLGWT